MYWKNNNKNGGSNKKYSGGMAWNMERSGYYNGRTGGTWKRKKKKYGMQYDDSGASKMGTWKRRKSTRQQGNKKPSPFGWGGRQSSSSSSTSRGGGGYNMMWKMKYSYGGGGGGMWKRKRGGNRQYAMSNSRKMWGYGRKMKRGYSSKKRGSGFW